LVTNDPNDVWICTTDGQMSQICILNSLPEISVSSYNTVCNSRITCIQCVPPYRLKHVDSNSKKLNKEENLLLNTDDDLNENPSNNESSIINNDKKNFLRQASCNIEPEFAIDYDSSDDDDDDIESQSDDLNNNNNNNLILPARIPLFTSNYDLKHSTMWIGNEDGRYWNDILSYYNKLN
jgi:hypothetical protein